MSVSPRRRASFHNVFVAPRLGVQFEDVQHARLAEAPRACSTRVRGADATLPLSRMHAQTSFTPVYVENERIA